MTICMEQLNRILIEMSNENSQPQIQQKGLNLAKHPDDATATIFASFVTSLALLTYR
ncbi:MAG: hypothetical protein OXR62_14875 [Ahrensia sp.]|nr:hypothetical protein [Ahrensia sp.]